MMGSTGPWQVSQGQPGTSNNACLSTFNFMLLVAHLVHRNRSTLSLQKKAAVPDNRHILRVWCRVNDDLVIFASVIFFLVRTKRWVYTPRPIPAGSSLCQPRRSGKQRVRAYQHCILLATETCSDWIQKPRCSTSHRSSHSRSNKVKHPILSG